jgi:hypothetical protein
MKKLALSSAQKESLSAFQIKVYEACMQIPSGKVGKRLQVSVTILD